MHRKVSDFSNEIIDCAVDFPQTTSIGTSELHKFHHRFLKSSSIPASEKTRAKPSVNNESQLSVGGCQTENYVQIPSGTKGKKDSTCQKDACHTYRAFNITFSFPFPWRNRPWRNKYALCNSVIVRPELKVSCTGRWSCSSRSPSSSSSSSWAWSSYSVVRLPVEETSIVRPVICRPADFGRWPKLQGCALLLLIWCE